MEAAYLSIFWSLYSQNLRKNCLANSKRSVTIFNTDFNKWMIKQTKLEPPSYYINLNQNSVFSYMPFGPIPEPNLISVCKSMKNQSQCSIYVWLCVCTYIHFLTKLCYYQSLWTPIPCILIARLFKEVCSWINSSISIFKYEITMLRIVNRW